MGKCTFKGGCHPYDGKEFSKDKPIKELFPAVGEMVFPLSQHIGAPAKPVVAKGDYVLAGQLIAEAGGFVSANIHSSVSGTVKAIEPRTLATGGKCNSIIIENDGEFKEVEYTPMKFEDLTKDVILERIKAAGVVGMGGAGFPTNVKLSPKNPEAIDYIIVNGAECEPYLTSDYRRLLEESDKVVMGLKIALKIFDHAKGIIGIEDNKPEAIRIMQEATASEPDIEVKPLKTKYPQGGERSLIYATTGRAINSSMLPADAGCIVHNVDTIFSIYLSVIEGKPLTKRICTVTGDGVKEPGNFYVWLGTNYRQLLDLDAKYPSYPKVAASVIAKDSGNWFSTFTIDKGKKDGVDVGMNVLAGSGLVGIVTDAGDNFAKVRCIIDDASKVSGMVSTTEDNLTVSGNIKTMNDDKVITFTELKDDDNKVKEGDPVVTSYVSDRYQQGILIGYVTKIENNSNNLTKSGTITPVVDFEHIENVMVITQLKQTGDTKTADDTESTETAGDSQTENSTENK